ncbi:alkane hydroxylase MAH1 [Ricinus communis]|uniref:Cytochrome P450, putative n=1 Tax=Ricinus communis TaxID=3988 RepID=B9S657_RICCO|nr:alkane hydroxylase MAH1 [Ricinus communis]EEF40966.1 cytochrome P450, putative [Ricinus communis]|eukprot:XP_025013528.1 alkane hydroxylase MAH1 [Ricinus communis]
MAILLLGLLIVFLSTAFLWSWWRDRSSLINWPVVGMIPGLFSNLYHAHDFLTSRLLQSEGTFLFKGPWFSGMNFLVTADPMIVHHTLSKNFANYVKGADFKQILEVLGDGIFNADSDSWRFQRRTIHFLLKQPSFQMAVERTMKLKVSKGLFSVLDNASKLGCEVDIQDVFQRFTFDSICMLVLSFDPECLSVEFPNVPFEKAFDCIEEVIFYRYIVPISIWKLQRWLQIGQERTMRKAWETFDFFVEQCLARKREQLDQRKNTVESENFDLLTYFLVEDGGEDGVFTKSNKFVRDMTFNLLLAGRDTVGAGLVWLFWLVAAHPFVEQKILEEIREHLGENTGEKWRLFNVEELSKLVYLHAVVCETLRLYPPVPFEVKVPVESDILPGGHHVNRDIKILYSLYSMGRMEDIWGKDCLKFRPERWISEAGKIKQVPSYKFTAFNAGPRTCLGKELGFVEMKLVASAIIWNYSIKVVEDHPVSPSLSLILYMKDGLKVRVAKRNAT